MTADDYLIDLGSGDRRTVITAANAVPGTRYDTTPTWLKFPSVPKQKVFERATFEQADILSLTSATPRLYLFSATQP